MTQWNKFHKWSHSKCAFSLFYYVFYCHYYFSWHARFIEQGAAEPVFIRRDILVKVFWAREMMPRLILPSFRASLWIRNIYKLFQHLGGTKYILNFLLVSSQI